MKLLTARMIVDFEREEERVRACVRVLRACVGVWEDERKRESY